MLPEVWLTPETGSEISATTAEIDYPVIREFLLVHRRRYGIPTREDTVQSSVLSGDFVSCISEPPLQAETPQALHLTRTLIFEDSTGLEICVWPVDQIAQYLMPANPDRSSLGHQVYTEAHCLTQIIEDDETEQEEEYTTATLYREFSFILGYQSAVEDLEPPVNSHPGAYLSTSERYTQNRNMCQESSGWSMAPNLDLESEFTLSVNGHENHGTAPVALPSASNLNPGADFLTGLKLDTDSPLAQGHPQDLVYWLSSHFKKLRKTRPASIDGIIMSRGASQAFQRQNVWYKQKKWVPLNPLDINSESNRNVLSRLARRVMGRSGVEQPRSFCVYHVPGERFSGFI